MVFSLRGDPDVDGRVAAGRRRQVVVENRFHKLVVEPRKGGRVVQFLIKKNGVELVRPKLGILWDRFWQAPRRQDPWAGEYEAKFLQRDAERVVLRLSREATGNWNFHGIDKTVTVTAGSSRILVDYTYRVHENRMTPSIISPWVVNGMSPAGEENKLFIPLTDGIRMTAYTPTAPPMHQKFHYNPARGWMAAAGQKSSTGVAATMDLSRVMSFYMWFGNNLNTMEWMYNTSEIRHGETLKLSHEIIPFRGLRTVAGAGGGVVVQLDVPGKTKPGAELNVGVKVYDSLAGSVDVSVKCEKLPGRLSKTNQKRTLDIPVDATRSFSFPWRPTDSGTYAVHGEVFRAGAKICDFELPVRVGKTKETYTLQPLVKRIGNPDERFGAKGAALSQKDIPELEFKDDVVTPHVKWGKPYYRGPLRVFMLTDQMQGRDIIELKQRMQIECITPLAIVNKRLFTGDLYGKYTTEMAVFDLTTRLKKKDFDVIVIGGGCQIWTAEQRKMIADLVRGGIGLVWTSAPTPEELKDILPLDASRTIRYRCPWQAPVVENHPVTLQMPLQLLPRTKVQTSKLAAGATVLAEAADGHRRLPLIAVKDAAGQGRVVQMTFGSSWQSPGAAYGGIVPFDEMDAREPYPYWEYWYSLIAKAILWAGRHEAPAQPIVTKLNCKPIPGELADCTIDVGLTEAIDLPEPQVELVLRDSYAGKISRSERPWRGESISFDFGAVVGSGRYFVDLRFTAQGKAVSWGTYGFEANGGTSRKAVKLYRDDESDVFNDGEELAGYLGLAYPGPGIQVLVQLYDGFERLLSSTTVPAQAEVKFSLPVNRPLHPGGVLVTRLVKDNKTLSINKRYVTLIPAKWAAQEWDDFTGIVWGVLGAYQRSWLGRAKADIMRDLGYNAHNAIARWAPIDSVWPTRLGFRLVSMNTLKTSHDPKNDETTRAKYRESGNKLDLVRKPSLSDPEFLTKVTDGFKRFVEMDKRYNFIGYIFADELWYDGRRAARSELCHSPSCVKGFHEYLQKKYAKIAALNAAWSANYRSFSDIAPVLMADLKERRKRIYRGQAQNLVDWLDHKMYVESVVADFMDSCNKATDYKIKIGLGGTRPNAGDCFVGFDWWKLVGKRKMRCVVSYGGAQVEIIRSFMHPDAFFTRWGGGYDPHGQNEKGHRQGPWGMLFRDADACAYFFGAPYSPMLFPDLT
ncbi:MAG: beta-galactosidase, partial [Planctomycetota bacterium]|nr:beta-galactosidase [Planctomycetota bacterium]